MKNLQDQKGLSRLVLMLPYAYLIQYMYSTEYNITVGHQSFSDKNALLANIWPLCQPIFCNMYVSHKVLCNNHSKCKVSKMQVSNCFIASKLYTIIHT